MNLICFVRPFLTWNINKSRSQLSLILVDVWGNIEMWIDNFVRCYPTTVLTNVKPVHNYLMIAVKR